MHPFCFIWKTRFAWCHSFHQALTLVLPILLQSYEPLVKKSHLEPKTPKSEPSLQTYSHHLSKMMFCSTVDVCRTGNQACLQNPVSIPATHSSKSISCILNIFLLILWEFHIMCFKPIYTPFSSYPQNHTLLSCLPFPLNFEAFF